MDPRDPIPYQRPNNGANLEKIASIRSKQRSGHGVGEDLKTRESLE